MEINPHAAPAPPNPASANSADNTVLQGTLAKYLEHVRVEKRLAQRTQQLYYDSLVRLQKLAQSRSLTPEALTAADLRAVLAQLHGVGYSAGSLAIVLSGWRGYYRWLGLHGNITADPTAGIRPPKRAKPLPKALDVEEALQLVQFRDDKADPAVECRDVLIAELLYSSGLRVSELVGLDTAASKGAAGYIDTAAGEARILGKGSKWRTVPVGAPALDALRAYLPHRRQRNECATGTQKVQPGHEAALLLNARGRRMAAASVWHMLKQRSLRAGLSIPVHPHMLRHSFASHILQSSRDLRAVQELLGHANIATTQVYTRLDFQHLAQTYASAHPRATLSAQTPPEGRQTDTDHSENQA